MSAGTVTLTKGSKTVTGSGTSFTTELKSGDFIVATVGGTTYTLGVAAIASNTSLTVSVAYDGPTTAGLAWQAVPLATLNLITSALAAQVSYAIRANNLDRDNWQQIFTGTGNVTVRLPDGTSWTGPAWNSIVTLINAKAASGANNDITSLAGLTTALSIQQGGTGAKDGSQAWLNLLTVRTPATARSDLQLGTSAVRDAYSATGAILSVGDFGIGGTSGGAIVTNANLINANGIWGAGGSAGLNYFDNYSPILMMFRTPTTSGQLQATIDGRLAIRGYNGSTMTAWNQCYTTGNTTRATDGTLRAASPIVRVVKSKEYCTRPDIDELDFQWCGAGVANAEAEGVRIERQSTGVYLLTGSAGLAKSGWQMSPPRDPQGSGDMGIVEAQQDEDGTLTLRLYKRRYVMTEDGDIEVAKGALIDVPPTSWIDVRLDMPSDSIWNINHPVVHPESLKDSTDEITE